jgi:membrane protein implicated in regulation of membrane protease activity
MFAAAWLTAATGVLALLAVVTAWYARRAFREQSREVRLLQEQAELQQAELQQAELQQAELQRTANDRRRARAIGVYVTGIPG